MIRIVLLALGCAVAVAAYAQTPAPTVRGVVAGVTGDALTLTSRAGGNVTVRLGPKTRMVAVVAASRDDLKPNAFIGVAAVPEGDGLKALEVHVFPEAMRGTGEGFRAFDLAPGSSMTNGALDARVGGVDGDHLTVTYKGGSQQIRLPAEAPIVGLSPGERGDIKPGVAAIVRGAAGEDGVIDAAAVIVGRNGVVPPM
jgi:hypothetical protein